MTRQALAIPCHSQGARYLRKWAGVKYAPLGQDVGTVSRFSAIYGELKQYRHADQDQRRRLKGKQAWAR